MRRTDKEVLDRARMDEIIRDAFVCHLALAKDGQPYVVPLSFGYDGEALYFHTAPEGKKIEYFQSNPQVCFQFECGVELRRDPVTACKWTFTFESVIGYGRVAELLEPADKQLALNEIMLHYSGKAWAMDDTSISHVRVWKIAITSLTGKQSKPPPG